MERQTRSRSSRLGTALVPAFSSIFFFLSGIASDAETWVTMNDPVEVRETISEKGLDGKYWSFYFRRDGKMAYEQGGFISIREWSVRDDGLICMSIYDMPDKILGCETLSRNTGTPVRYRLEGQTGQAVVDIIAPDQALVDAVTEKAGATE